MIKKVLTVSAVTAMLLFSGCSSNDAEDYLQVQQDLDAGKYEAVISKLEDTDNTNEELMLLASAYMGRAGVSFSEVIKIMVESTEDSSDSSDDGFASFATAIADTKTSTTLTDLGKATDTYSQIMSGYNSECATDIPLSDAEESICLYLGLAYTVKTASTLSYLGNLESFGVSAEDGGVADDNLKASECAMQYAYEDRDGQDASSFIDDRCTATVVADAVTFVDSNKTYQELYITVTTDVNGTASTSEPYGYLMTEVDDLTGLKSTALTDGYCTLTDFSTRVDDEFSESYVCPINETAEEEDIVALDILVETLNNGTEAVIAAVGGDDDSDIAADIEEFKLEVDEDGDGVITEQDILDYLAAQN